MANTDPFQIPPDDWFAVLCERFSADERGRLNLERVFNETAFFEPPAESGIAPHGRLRGLLVVGMSRGLGKFSLEIELHDVDGNVLWHRDEPWEFQLGPGEHAAAVFVEKVDQWFSDAGVYYYVARLQPTGIERRIPFEVKQRPDESETDAPDP